MGKCEGIQIPPLYNEIFYCLLYIGTYVLEPPPPILFEKRDLAQNILELSSYW